MQICELNVRELLRQAQPEGNAQTAEDALSGLLSGIAAGELADGQLPA